MIVSPRGELLALAGPEPQLLITEIERAPLVEYRRDFPALADMRQTCSSTSGARSTETPSPAALPRAA